VSLIDRGKTLAAAIYKLGAISPRRSPIRLRRAIAMSRQNWKAIATIRLKAIELRLRRARHQFNFSVDTGITRRVVGRADEVDCPKRHDRSVLTECSLTGRLM
jgi:hypothetical protein